MDGTSRNEREHGCITRSTAEVVEGGPCFPSRSSKGGPCFCSCSCFSSSSNLGDEGKQVTERAIVERAPPLSCAREGA